VLGDRWPDALVVVASHPFQTVLLNLKSEYISRFYINLPIGERRNRPDRWWVQASYGTFNNRTVPAGSHNPMNNIDFRSSFLTVLALGISITAAPAQVSLNPIPTRAFGQAKLAITTIAPNLVEGREFNSPQAVAVDTSTTPPGLYVADTNNNRVLGWKNGKAANGTFADVVIGQRDVYSTFAQGPGTANPVGLSSPTGMAVDKSGNLYVVDSGNNRILRYPKPFQQSGDLIQPDLIIGQASPNAKQPNLGDISNKSSEKSVWTAGSNAVLTTALLFDSAGNLWFSDSGNNRVLRYPAANLSGNLPAADLVLGQPDFTTKDPLSAGNVPIPPVQQRKTGTYQPSAMAMDSAGRLFVADAYSRVLVYEPPFRNGKDASRIVGIVAPVPQGQPPRSIPNQWLILQAAGLFTIGNNLFVVDSSLNRILRFDPYDTWTAESADQPSPAAKAVFGQPDLLSPALDSSGRTRPQKEASATTYLSPSFAVVAGSDVYLVDSGNHRVLVIPQQGNAALGSATNVYGQVAFNLSAPNLVEGRELYLYAGQVNTQNNTAQYSPSGGLVVDQRSDPPRLYIADTYNHRILGFQDARKVKSGDFADYVIGQVDLSHSQINAPTNDANQPNDTGLFAPVGVAVDAAGNVWVSDSGNSRVLRFPKPDFSSPQTSIPHANLLIGQSSYNFSTLVATRTTMGIPSGITFSNDGHLIVADRGLNRVLLFRKPAGGDFISGMQATTVIGQPDFTSSSTSGLNTPMHIAVDSDDRLYVSDTGNGRVLIYNFVVTASNNPSPGTIISSGTTPTDPIHPQGIWVSAATGEIWLTDPSRNRVLRYPRYDQLFANPQPDYKIDSVFPLAVTLDAFGNLLIADGTNRIAFHYPAIDRAVNAGSNLIRPLSPGMIGTLYPTKGATFGSNTAAYGGYPSPRELADVQVTINDQPVPLYYLSPTQINFQVPFSAPTSGTVDIQVVQKSTGLLYATATAPMATATPGFFTANYGQGQIAAFNEDGVTLNTGATPIARSKVITLYGTGFGLISPNQSDDTPPTAAISMSRKPVVVIGTTLLTDAQILYAGLSPGFVGLYQLNVLVPDSVPPGTAIPVAIQVDSVPSNQSTSGARITTTISVKQ
jgi:uncharacterized protein (TIGR03437 family)